MLSFLRKFVDFNAHELSRINQTVVVINRLEDKARKLKDEQFKNETEKLKAAIQGEKQPLDEALPWAFALVREASRRVLGIRHFDVQLIAGIALHEGKVIEQRTGEGKTLAATTALYLNALTGKGVHLVTVNDYLARRDAGWMGMIFSFLGLSTSSIIGDQSYLFDSDYVDSEARDWRLSHLRPVSRKEAYAADITYGINSEFGFDYLRDNMAGAADQLVQRGFSFAIIDEADSVLIDEARTPHIISAPSEEDTSKYYLYAKIVKQLDPKTDFVIDEKLKTASLTEAGVMHIEQMLNVPNIYEKDFDTLFHIEASLKAETLFKIDKDYIVKDGEVVIVDEFTGRLLNGRRFSEGLHQAIEAKENVPIQKESKTLATVSLQNYFRMYAKLGGMTGTAQTEAEEMHKIYKVDVIVVPTHREVKRVDYPDMIYKTENGKYAAVVDEIVRNYKIGRPVLVGTTSIEKNELVSRLLKQKGIPHELLNAKNHEREADIIARAGAKGAITIATNMAGRGVDIVLGGAPPTVEGEKDTKKTEADYKKEYEKWSKQHDEVVRLGGLCVIGTERHESRRIDNQLRGRAGRQGDPGETRFFVALEDDIMRIFGGEQISKLMSFLNYPEDQPLSHAMVSKAIEQAQVKVEGFNFDIRKHLVQFDDVLNKQREIIYALRYKVLRAHEDSAEFRKTIEELFEEEIATLTSNYLAMKDDLSDEEIETLAKDIDILFPQEHTKVVSYLKKHDFEGLQNHLVAVSHAYFEKRVELLSEGVWFDISKMIFLQTIDQFWTEHLTAIEDLREGINLRGYAQLDPLVEYKNEAYSMFEKLVGNINYETARRLLRVEIEASPQESTPEKKEINPPKEKKKKTPALTASPTPIQQPKGKIGRNDPCWCGSGKKYKKCHMLKS
ncbi:preprotein translocase subunit SecA [Candidatus Roizmanbacteria bacterium]|nr:preprotein translocase subunit SecA [Candidatus Roizmanbacteria bacterium]